MRNPAFREGVFAQRGETAASEAHLTTPSASEAGRMTLNGVVLRSALLLLLLVGAGVWAWNIPEASMGGVIALGATLGLVLGLVIAFRPRAAPWLSLAYAVCEGLVLGVLSSSMENKFPGIVVQAVGATLGVFVVMLVLYRTRIIPVTRNLQLGIVAATGGIALYYIISLVLGLGFGVGVPLIDDPSPIGIVFSVIVCAVAAANLLLDFDFIEQGVEQGAPRYMEWYAAFGLLVTLIWLYLEILRLLGKARR